MMDPRVRQRAWSAGKVRFTARVLTCVLSTTVGKRTRSIPTNRPDVLRNMSTLDAEQVSPKLPQNDNLDQSAILLKAGLRPFEPRRGLRNPHLQTIIGNYLRRPPFRGQTAV